MHNLLNFFLLILIASFSFTGCEESWDNMLAEQEQTENVDDSGTGNNDDFTKSLDTVLDANCANHEELTDYIASNTEAINFV